MKRILKEPLLHFLLLGAGLFFAYSLRSNAGRGMESDQIVVTEGQIEHLAVAFTRTWQRPPTAEELLGLIHDRVREEVYCREAMAMGLDRDDPIIRRRLRQKMEFLTDDVAAAVEPTDAELDAYLKEHRDVFRVEPILTFRQVYLSPEQHGEQLASDAARLFDQLRKLGANTDASGLGDASLLEHRFSSLRLSDVAKQFGDEFAAQLSELSAGEWHGPLGSGYGLHLVFVSERTESYLPALAEVRDTVRREWDNARRLETNENFYRELLQRYTVTIEGLEATAADSSVTSR